MTEEQYQYLEKKYGKLIWKIAHRISGDVGSSGLEDNAHDLWITVFDAIKAYESKVSKPSSEFLESEEFGQYLKTCLWHKKANKGVKITARNKRLKKISLETINVGESRGNANNIAQSITLGPTTIVLEDTKYTQWTGFFEELFPNLDKQEQEAVNQIVMDPNLFKDTGELSVNTLASKLNLNWPQTRKLLDSIGFKLKNKL